MFLVGTGYKTYDHSLGFFRIKAEAILQRPLPNAIDIGVKFFYDASYVSPLTADVKLDVVGVHVTMAENDQVHEVVFKKRKKHWATDGTLNNFLKDFCKTGKFAVNTNTRPLGMIL
jgi:hypothetical protein